MGYEVDFLPVGEGEKSGDAIAVRWGDLTGPRSRQFVMVIDGGTLDSGERLVEHIRTVYGTDTVDLALNTHPDGDHASGLEVVLDELTVGRLWMHRPWTHSADIKRMFEDGTLSNDRLSRHMREALTDAWDLEKIARRKGIPITEPFSDGEANRQYPGVTVLGPSTAYYQSLLPGFRDMPDAREAASYLAEGYQWFKSAAAAVAERVLESWGRETLTEPEEDATSAENNSSVVLLLRIDGRQLLFTGDAGVPALTRAADLAAWNGIDLTACHFQQVPHHGSKRNVGPTILNRIVGPRLAPQAAAAKMVFVSAAKEGMPKHPAKKVVNAYIRRGAKVLATQGEAIRHGYDAPNRPGWGLAIPLPFYPEVEE